MEAFKTVVPAHYPNLAGLSWNPDASRPVNGGKRLPWIKQTGATWTSPCFQPRNARWSTRWSPAWMMDIYSRRNGSGGLSLDHFTRPERQDLIIEPIAVPTQDVTDLLTELDNVLSAEYAPEQRHALKIDAIFQPHIRFFLAHIGSTATACGGVAFYRGFAEVKRIYVRPTARGRGVAQAILARIEAEARRAGYTVLRLETGERQAEAMRLYIRAGFRRCAPFGDYAAMTHSAIATSVFFEKQLS